MALVSATLKYHWDRVQEETVVKQAKPKTTCSTFTTQKATTGEDADKLAAAKPNKSSKKPKKKKKSEKRKRTTDSNLPANSASNVAAAATTTSSGSNLLKKLRRHCIAYGEDSHNFSKCYLVVEELDKDWVNRETFGNNMKVPSFRKKVTDFCATLTSADAPA